ncbi:hypothetical protein [Streptomyces melanogenes]|uniref:hypothetical protein n=1 Tax=Streptomyces melanogenes TaxID=67326 RepID=UPI00167E5C64|nr:hypothetical protein [Streptomyces melanogenes]GGP80677.1 hypothetical protein GCM10010278_68980 [Streptomyces melanogenes]
MTTTPRSPRLLVLSTALLAVAGVALLGLPQGQQPLAPAASPAASATTDPSPHASSPTADAPARGAPASTPTPLTPAADESALPPHGEGTAGDTAVQRALEAAWPSDLPDGDARELLAAGRDLLRADATGIGRAHWPALFPASQGLAPAFATSRFRIQAVIARRDGSPDKAVVHLVWAGTDRGGTFTDGRITDWHFARSTTQKEASTWTPQPRS